MNVALIHAPTVLGLKPTGVETMPEALEAAGLADRLPVASRQVVQPPDQQEGWPKVDGIKNAQAVADYSVLLANAVQGAVELHHFPLVLGGDCSIVLGAMLGLKRLGAYGLFFMDGHADFYQPEASETGEVADMDLALATGRGPRILSDLEGRGPLVSDDHAVQFGQRDRRDTLNYGSRQISDTGIRVFELDEIRSLGLKPAVERALEIVGADELSGFWIHMDADVINDSDMPAVDYRLPGGMEFAQMSAVLRQLVVSGRVAGMSLSIFNPKLDKTGEIAGRLVQAVATGLL